MNPFRRLFELLSSAFGDAMRWLGGQRSMQNLADETVEGYEIRLKTAVTSMGTIGASRGEVEMLANDARKAEKAAKRAVEEQVRHIATLTDPDQIKSADQVRATKLRTWMRVSQQKKTLEEALAGATRAQQTTKHALQEFDAQRAEVQAEAAGHVVMDQTEEVLIQLTEAQLAGLGALDTGSTQLKNNLPEMRKRVARKTGRRQGLEQARDALVESRGLQVAGMMTTPLDDDEQAALNGLMEEMGMGVQKPADTSSNEATS